MAKKKAREDQYRVFFFHLHKCAGTSFVELYKQAGWKMAPGHRYGNPPAFSMMRCDTVSEAAAIESIGDAEFFTTEWQVQPWMFEIPSLKIGIFREPWDRYVSNFRFDKTYWSGPITYAKYISEYRDVWNYTKFNYYTRLFSGQPCMSCGGVEPPDLARAIENIRKLDAVMIVGDTESYKVVDHTGVDSSMLGTYNQTEGHHRESDVAYFKEEFTKRAKYDYIIWQEVLRLKHTPA